MVAAFAWCANTACGQVEFTEIMYRPGGNDSLWEWVEIRNTTGAPVNLEGWVFDDDDDPHLGDANITAGNEGYNTMVPANGVAVLYPGDELQFMPQRFTDAWGSGFTLIPVRGFTSLLDAGDAIGLWSSHTAYLADTTGSMTSPRRTFASAAASLDYSETNGFPVAGNGRSIAWTGVGSSTVGVNWVESDEDDDYGSRLSEMTTIASAQINSTSDRGNPGAVPTGPAAGGLLITEIMFAPASPLVEVGFNSDDFEWVEIHNNTSTAIDFEQTPYVFDDDDGGALGAANITTGMLGIGETGILFHDDVITETHMQAMWGNQINFIPVTVWPGLNNTGGDTIAIWDSFDAYEDEPETGSGRTHENAIAVVTYGTVAGDGWPTINTGDSIFLRHLIDNPEEAASWMRAGTNGESLSANATAIFQMATDHPGDDVGSPGFVPNAAGVPGDYNGNGVVDAADYTYWRDRLGDNAPLPNTDPNDTDGMVTAAEYAYWVSRFGATSGSGSGSLTSGAVPEPGGVALVAIGLGCLRFRRRWRPIRRSRPQPVRL
jgi:hypothetical protein